VAATEVVHDDAPGEDEVDDCDCETSGTNERGASCTATLMPSLALCAAPAPKHAVTLHEQVNDGSGLRAVRHPICHTHYVALKGDPIFATEA
jgi:hypothetical protein